MQKILFADIFVTVIFQVYIELNNHTFLSWFHNTLLAIDHFNMPQQDLHTPLSSGIVSEGKKKY